MGPRLHSGTSAQPGDQLRVEEVAQRVAKEVRRQNGQRNRGAREDDQPPRRLERLCEDAAQHVAQAGRRRRHAWPMTSVPARSTGMAWAWMGVGSTRPWDSRARCSAGWTSKWANDVARACVGIECVLTPRGRPPGPTRWRGRPVAHVAHSPGHTMTVWHRRQRVPDDLVGSRFNAAGVGSAAGVTAACAAVRPPWPCRVPARRCS